MGWFWLRAGLGAAVLAAASACSPAAFECQGGDQCGSGQCWGGYCAFPDASCPSGFTYGEYAPSHLAKTCVPTAGDTAAASSSSSSSGSSSRASTDTVDPTTGSTADPQPLTAESSTASEHGTSTTDPPDPTTASESTGSGNGRVTDALIALYRFDDGADEVIDDLSDVDPLVPLTIVVDGDSPSWGADGLVFEGSGIARAMGASSKIRQRLQATTAFTFEVWTTPSELVQSGPPRLVTLSIDSVERSVSLMHGGINPPDGQGLPLGDQYGLRLVTSDLPGTNGMPPILTESIAALQPTHVVATRDVDGLVTIWVDGEPRSSEVRTGDFSPWGEDHMLAVGNELSGMRGYAGTIHLVAIYERPLTDDEIATNRDAGY